MAKYDIVVIGASAGGLDAFRKILSKLDENIKTPIVIVQHMGADSRDSILNLFKKYSTIPIVEPLDKDYILENKIYLAPADYHIIIEHDKSISLNLGPKENFCRPSIDVLFETAAETYFEKTLGIILTGANNDGAKGCRRIKECSGYVIAQDPNESTISIMPQSAIDTGCVDKILTVEEIVVILNSELKE